jgi:hypothetical protein
MEVKMQTSFIPKKPIIESSSAGSGISLFMLIAVIIFIITISLTAIVWLWQGSLVKKIDEARKTLSTSIDAYKDQEATFNDLIRLSDRIQESKNLLAKHIAITPVFILLEKNIVQNVQLKNLKFSYVDDKNIKVDLTGTARNYDALSKQADYFGMPGLRDYISEPAVSNFTLNSDGTVSFNFSTLVNFKLVSYENKMGDGTNNQVGTSTTNL